MKRKHIDEQKMVQDIMDNFDWQRCHRTMGLIGWSWHYIGVPTISDLKDRARRLFQDAIEGVKKPDIHHNSYYFAATGGLKAVAWKNRYGHIIQLELEFVLTSWDTDGD